MVRFMRWNKRARGCVLLLFLSLAAGASDSAPKFVHKRKYAMGSVFEIVAYDPSPQRASAAIDRAFAEIVRLDELMSNYLPDSELSRLNKTAAFGAQPVSKDLYRIIQEALKYSQLSDGEFDITVGPLVNLWKAALAGGHEPSSEKQLAARNCLGYGSIRLIPPNRVTFISACLRLDLGALGKGYAVDRASEILRASGLKAALIDAGGSTVYALGAPPGKTGWIVHMRDPSGYVDPTVMLSDESISTSEQSRRSFLADSSAGHIIDPRTGLPLRTPFATSVVAKTATASDALSTTLLLIGPEPGDRLVRKLPGVAAIWIAADGETHSASTGPRVSISNHLAGRCLSGKLSEIAATCD